MPRHHGLTWREIKRLCACGAMRVRRTCTRGGHALQHYITGVYAGSATVISGPSCAATHTHGPPQYAYAYGREADYATAMQLRASRVDCNATAWRPVNSNSQPTALAFPARNLNRSLAIHKRGNNPQRRTENFAIVEASYSRDATLFS